MKKLLVLIFICVFTAALNAQTKWNIGVQLSGIGNMSKFSGGMSDANALFSHIPYGTGQISFYARKAFSSHFSYQTGIDISSIGFSYSIAQDYSLLKEEDEHHGYEFRVGTCIGRIPVSIIYNSNLYCRNIRFVTGAGLAIGFVDNKWETENIKTIDNGELGNTAPSVMKNEVHSTNTVCTSFNTFWGFEKVFSKGNMLSLTFLGNFGFNKVAESTVSYTVNNKNYYHTFSNYGSYAGMAITYYFKPVGSKKASMKHLPAVN